MVHFHISFLLVNFYCFAARKLCFGVSAALFLSFPALCCLWSIVGVVSFCSVVSVAHHLSLALLPSPPSFCTFRFCSFPLLTPLARCCISRISGAVIPHWATDVGSCWFFYWGNLCQHLSSHVLPAETTGQLKSRLLQDNVPDSPLLGCHAALAVYYIERRLGFMLIFLQWVKHQILTCRKKGGRVWGGGWLDGRVDLHFID